VNLYYNQFRLRLSFQNNFVSKVFPAFVVRSVLGKVIDISLLGEFKGYYKAKINTYVADNKYGVEK
jgi:hypothetical protein